MANDTKKTWFIQWYDGENELAGIIKNADHGQVDDLVEYDRLSDLLHKDCTINALVQIADNPDETEFYIELQGWAFGSGTKYNLIGDDETGEINVVGDLPEDEDEDEDDSHVNRDNDIEDDDTLGE